MKEYSKVMSEILLIKKSLLSLEKNSLEIGGWIPKKVVLRYFDYGDNQLRILEKKNDIKVSKIGRRKFYSTLSIIALIEKNIMR